MTSLSHPSLKMKGVSLTKYLDSLQQLNEVPDKLTKYQPRFIHDYSLIVMYDWTHTLGPVINQSGCANCYVESMIQLLNSQINYYMDETVKSSYFAPKGEPVLLSSSMLTHCTS